MAPSYTRTDSKGDSLKMPPSIASPAGNALTYASSKPLQYQAPSSATSPLKQLHQQPHQSASNSTNPSDPYSHHHRYAPQQRAGAVDPGHSRTDEVYRLPENANLAIPEEVREQFQQDEKGNILFFTAPPVDTLPAVRPGSAIGHTVEFLASSLPNRTANKQKRRTDTTLSIPNKKVKEQPDDTNLRDRIEATKTEALDMLIERITHGTTQIYREIYGQNWEAGRDHELDLLRQSQAEVALRLQAAEKRKHQRLARNQIATRPNQVFKDDWNPRY